MKLELNQKTNRNLKTKELLAHHDIVFRAPKCEWSYGLPIGDGETGCLLWMTDDMLHVQINHPGLIDDIAEGKEYTPTVDEENAVCRNGAQLNIKFPCPVFETIYQEAFEERLSLRDATASIYAKTPFSEANVRAFASHADKVTVVELEAEFDEASRVHAELKRWGSRTFMYWQLHCREDKTGGLDGTDSLSEEDCLCITQKLRGTNYCIAVKPIAKEKPVLRKAGSRSVEAWYREDTHIVQKYYITAALGKDTEDAKRTALDQIRAAEEKGIKNMYEVHVREWEEFWDKSYVVLPEEMDFLENLWYTNLYYANSQMRGVFNYSNQGGVWNTYHDFSPWNGYTHYNLQMPTFSLEAANHPELTETYYRFRRNQLPYAQRYARDVKHSKGAFYSDMCDRIGRMDVQTRFNCTPGSQIAMGMYQHYCYTGDEKFLQETALPVMRATAEFYMDQLKLQDDGYYHIYNTQGYEGSFTLTDDTVSDLSMIRALFTALIPYLSGEEAAAYQERLDKLVPYQTADFLDDELDAEGRFLWGIGKGRKPLTDHVLNVGSNPRVYVPDGLTPQDVPKDVHQQCMGVIREAIGPEKYRTNFGNPEHGFYRFPDIEMTPVFPSGVVGIKDKDSELYKLIYNTVCMHDRCMGWCMMPIFMARMGLADLLKEQMARNISQWVVYPQGFGTEGGNTYMTDRFKHFHIVNRDTGEHSLVPGWDFRYFNNESVPILCAAVNEMLLQSYDGTLRLFPAILEDSQNAFSLAAAGGRMVHAVYSQGECDVVIECIRGGELSVIVDHVKSEVVFTDADSGVQLKPKQEGDIYIMDTLPGQCISIKSRNAEKISFIKDYSRNTDVKYFGNAKLGTGKEF